ncbi:MFS transporter [Fluviispira vulneris]|uniref:MFS transporter n=1 Tax=Fluviispira vulneris TaxID=2763012 RepID=UPI001647AB73|nr:MFS transporter [Fluviispira vulneris]
MKKLLPILTVRFCSSLGDQALVYGIPILVFQLTGSMSASGMAFAIEWIPRLIAMPLSGAAADIFGPRKLLLSSDIFRFMLTLLAGFILLFPLNSNSTVALIFGVLGGAVGFFHEMAFVSFESLAPRLVSLHDLPKLHTLLQGLDLGTQIIAPGLAALLLIIFSPTAFILCLSFIFLSSFLFSSQSKLIKNASLDDIKNIDLKILHKLTLQQLNEGILFVLKSKNILALIAISIAMNFSIGIVLSGSAGYLKEGLGSTAQMAGALGTAAGVLGLISFIIIPYYLKKFSLFSLGFLGIVLFFIFNISIPMAQNFWLYGVLYAGLFLADGFYTVYMRSVRVTLIPKEVFSSAIGIILLLNFIFMPISGLALALFGGSAEYFRELVIVSSALFLIVSLFSLKALSKVRS